MEAIMGGVASRGTRRFGPVDWLDQLRLTGPNTDLRQGLERDILPKHLTRCRWYAAKDAGPPLVEIIDLVTCPEPIGDTALAVLRVTPPGREPQRYVLPLALAWADEGGLPDRYITRVKRDARLAALIDSFEANRVVRGLLDAMLATGPAAAHDASVAFQRTAALASRRSRLAVAQVERIAAEQSNTSVRFAEVAILKLFRRLEPGIHPELEIGRFLTETGFANTPQLLGWIELHPSNSDPAVLAVLQELIADATDGWSFVLQRLRDYARPAAALLPETPMLDLARQLGQRTAELHRAFAAQSEDPAFASEAVTPVTLRAWRDGARAMAASAIGALAQAAPGLPPATREQVDMVLARREQLLERIDTLLPERVDAVRTRVHGDFHLGQVLVANDDIFIIDFEGEPMRPLEERRGKQAPLRDVAGMLRSFAYAAATIRMELDAGPDNSWLDVWAAAMSATFLEAYRARIAGCPSLPTDPADVERLLQLFLLEKALYEVRYELANRPDWLGIPVAGVLGLLDQPPGHHDAPVRSVRSAREVSGA
jgi:trehalose synthase-fused probable maltokinase